MFRSIFVIAGLLLLQLPLLLSLHSDEDDVLTRADDQLRYNVNLIKPEKDVLERPKREIGISLIM